MTERPKSVARLAAERAFAAKVSPQPASTTPQIIVRRRRLIEMPSEGVTVGREPEAKEKSPRVFLAPKAPDQTQEVLRAAEVSESLKVDASPAAGTLRRAERIGHDRRAKVIRVVTLDARAAPVQVESEKQISGAAQADKVLAGASTTFGRELDAVLEGMQHRKAAYVRVSEDLAAIRETLELSRRARAFSLTGEVWAAQWRDLEEKVEKARKSLRQAVATPKYESESIADGDPSDRDG